MPRTNGTGTKEWWTSYFDARYLLEHEPMFDERTTRRDVARVLDVLQLPVGARILDVPCGQGRHAVLLADASYLVDGLDYSRHLLGVAKERTPARLSGSLHFRQGDMRTLPASWTGRYDAVLNLATSFGFFRHPADDAWTLREFARVLKPGGILVWQGANRDGVMARFISRDWWPTSDGSLMAHRRHFDHLSGILTVQSEWSGPTGTGRREYRLRLYTATRLAELLAATGLIVEEAFGGWTDQPLSRRAGEMLLVARKRELPRPRKVG
jgi:SAM-dependent methyltransferase